ncbi:alpha/beta hydrolase [Parvularcula sp. ZS-1/3]|uniref:Alpha/beta hydrolase n=1 Tax=Parvularcula mediterranea TaxID=2732508 RepID=A0A7Y3W434_9PROT|nr:alpha/beta hydrolase [Parvularcula mediterranea]NNU15114.1 alpha/beta hydrolase [Parvularcula mediterranea]
MLRTFLAIISGVFLLQPATGEGLEPRVVRDLAYTTGPEADALQKLNLVLPQSDEAVPLFIWIGGGAWSYVDRNREMDLAERVAEEGIAVASVGHRLSSAVWQDPEKTEGVQHPAHVEDIAAATAWLIANAEKYGFDLERVVIGGFSSGAHLASLVAADPQYLTAHDLNPEVYAGVVAVGGAYDMADYHRVFRESPTPEMAEQHVEAVFGADMDGIRDASPASYIDQFDRPLLLMSDARTYRYTKLFEDALAEAEKSQLAITHVRHLDHGPLWRDLSDAESSAYRDQIVHFIKNGLAQPAANP